MLNRISTASMGFSVIAMTMSACTGGAETGTGRGDEPLAPSVVSSRISSSDAAVHGGESGTAGAGDHWHAAKLSARGPDGFPRRFVCGDQPVVAVQTAAGVRVVVNDRTLSMIRVSAASGAKYALQEEEETWFWTRGERAILEVEGVRYPECVAPAARLPLTARGNEPFWQLTVRSSAVVMTGLDPVRDAQFGAPAIGMIPDGRRYRASGGRRTVVAEVVDTLCIDSMSGMPFPLRAEVELDGRAFSGCAGKPAWLLTGAGWRVEDLAGDGLVDRSLVTVDFRPEGQLLGSGGCNRYRGVWTMSGEALAIREIASTDRACVPSLMEQERRFFEILNAVVRYTIETDGGLKLYAADGRTVAARQ